MQGLNDMYRLVGVPQDVEQALSGAISQQLTIIAMHHLSMKGLENIRNTFFWFKV